MSTTMLGEDVMEAIILVYENDRTDLFRALYHANIDLSIGDVADLTLRFHVDKELLEDIVGRLGEAKERLKKRWGRPVEGESDEDDHGED